MFWDIISSVGRDVAPVVGETVTFSANPFVPSGDIDIRSTDENLSRTLSGSVLSALAKMLMT